jgi:DNA invertase Pin-like site-specific DNA recombinase
VLYARLSVSKEESVSIARQLDSCRAYAKARSWEVLGEFIDDGVSATANRPEDRRGWAGLLAADGFDAVVIWKVDRLARRVLDFLHADEALQARGAGLVAVEDPIDMTSPQGRAFAVMLAVFGEMEAEAMRSRVRAARTKILQDGRWPGGGVPYGYMPVNNPNGPGRILTKDPTLIGWTTRIATKALRGETVNSIARWLTTEGAPVPGRRAVASGDWSRQTVLGLLRNPVLAGMRPHNPGRGRQGGTADPFNVVRDSHGDPLIDESLAVLTVDQFTELQVLLQTKATPQSRKQHERRSTSPLLSRVVRCDACDVFMCRGTNQGKPVLTCPRCRQTISRVHLDPHLARRLVKERGAAPLGDSTVRDQWRAAKRNPSARREILLTQIDSLRVRRGAVGRFDPKRVRLKWRTQPDQGVTR